MNFENIDKKSPGYTLLYYYAKFIHDKFFYRKVIYTGLENIPKDKPVLIAPNHQNALMDALAILFSAKRRVIFLARSDIFRNPILAKVLIFLRILPVYRLRDGKEKLKLNDIIYNKTIQILEKHHPLSIFPEAAHNNKMHLQRFKKGIQRVALMTQDKNNNEIDVQIVPAGIYYSNYFNFRSVLQVNYGKPISVSEYYESFKENEARAMVALGNDMFKEILKLAIDVRDEENYDVYKALLDIYDKKLAEKEGVKKLKQRRKFNIDKKTIEIAENISKNNSEEFNLLAEKVRKYAKGLNKFRIRDWVLEKKCCLFGEIMKSLITIIGFPIFSLGFILNAIPYSIPSLITKNIKDPQFFSSIRYAIGVIVFPIYYLLFFVITGAVSGHWLCSLTTFVFVPILGLIAFGYHRFFVKFTAQLRFAINKKKPEVKEMILLRKEIIDIMNGK